VVLQVKVVQWIISVYLPFQVKSRRMTIAWVSWTKSWTMQHGLTFIGYLLVLWRSNF